MPFPDARMETAKFDWTQKASKWCITYWLTEGRTEETLKELVKNMPENWAMEGQIEQGHCKDDKLHAQLFLKTENTRASRIRKYFPNCYINKAENPFALKNYVHKTDTRVAEFMTVENRSPQWSVVRDKFFDWIIENEPFYGHIKDDMDERVSPRLELWDKFINLSVAEGMSIELIGVNPQYRSAVRRYWSGMITCAEKRATSVDRQTDRQNIEIPTLAPPPSIQEVGRQGGVSHRVKKSDLFAPL